MEKIVYTIPEVADMLCISKSHAYDLVKRRILPVLELGGRRVIPKALFDEWVLKHANPTE